MSTISASVGKYDNGAHQCHNIPKDQSIVIELLNKISQAQGGRREKPLTNSPQWGITSTELYTAILAFQRAHPPLSVDGHVDPGQGALRKLDELASTPAPLPSVPTGDLPDAIRRNPDYVERRVKGVGILGLGGPFRLDLELNANRYATKSIFMDRTKFSFAPDPFAGNTEIALTGIYPSEVSALGAIRNSGFVGPGYVVYTHYRGPENIIFPTIMSATTTPALLRALGFAVNEERQYAMAASKTLLQAFFTLAGLRYMPVTDLGGGGGAAAAAGDVQALRQTAQTLLRSQPAGRAVVNLGGVGEVEGAINVNPLLDQQVAQVPNLIKSGAEAVGDIFPNASVDKIVSNNVVFGQVNWATTAQGCSNVLRPGGTVSIAPYAGQLAEHLQAIAAAFRSAGFRNVEIIADHIVTAIR